MRPCIPNSSAIDSGFRSLEKRLVVARRKINAAAAAQMKADEYETAKEWMSVGRSVADFAERVAAFADEWKRLVKAARITARANHSRSGGEFKQGTGPKSTPAWKFCVPGLQAVVKRGGTADMGQVLADLEGSLTDKLTEKDRAVDSKHGNPKWHSSVRRAYRQSQREGWIEKGRDGQWKITQRGRAIAAEGS
jgi:hypothetical protein